METQSNITKPRARQWYKNNIPGRVILIGAIITIAILTLIYFSWNRERKSCSYCFNGEVEVKFKEDLSINDIKLFLQKLNLSPIDSQLVDENIQIFGYENPEEVEKKFAADFKKWRDEGIADCNWKKPAQRVIIYCTLNPTLPLRTLDAVGIPMFYAGEILSTIVKVPEGQEESWAKRLERYPEIDFARPYHEEPPPQ